MKLRNLQWLRNLACASSITFALYAASVTANEKHSPASCDREVSEIIKKMTLDEKIQLTSGVDIYKTIGVPRLGIPGLDMTDGPAGVVLKNKHQTTTFPAGVAMAATWNPQLVGQAAAAMAKETKLEGHNMLLGPCINIHRSPLGGRNFESITGEDPYLGSQMAPAFVKGVQDQGVLTSTKHFALNNQEFDRLNLSVVADERTMNELYFPAFQSAVKAGTTSMMAAYNRVLGEYACSSPFLLTETLKKKWGFKGFAISDWGANHSTAPSIQAGLDLEMPYVMPAQGIDVPPKFTRELVKKAIATGEMRESQIDEMVKRQLSAMCSVGALHPKVFRMTDAQSAALLRSHASLSRKVAEEGTVLLKNDLQLLPLHKGTTRSIAIIGPNATQFPSGGGGSSRIGGVKITPPADAIRSKMPGVTVVTAADQRESTALDQASAIESAVAAAKKSDVAVLFVGENELTEQENQDRAEFKLTAYQKRLVEAVSKANPRTVVVLNGGGAIAMDPWVQDTSAVLQAWYLGQGGGEAIASLLTGEANPSGKLPVTFEKSRESCSDAASFPKSGQKELVYSEGIFVGYRSQKSQPLFPFGHGLSYTKFGYSNLRIRKNPRKSPLDPEVEVTFIVKNEGKTPGAEVAQLYVGEQNSRLPRPIKELKGFSKVELKPGESRIVTLKLDRSSFSYYDPEKHEWMMDPHRFRIQVGSSSQDIRLEGETSFEQGPRAAENETPCPNSSWGAADDYQRIKTVYEQQIRPLNQN